MNPLDISPLLISEARPKSLSFHWDLFLSHDKALLVDSWLIPYSTFNFVIFKAATPEKRKESRIGLRVWRSTFWTQLNYWWSMIMRRSFTLNLFKVFPVPSISYFHSTYHSCCYLMSDSCPREWWLRAQIDFIATLPQFKSWLHYLLYEQVTYSFCFSFRIYKIRLLTQAISDVGKIS